jgi:hypothetical protein
VKQREFLIALRQEIILRMAAGASREMVIGDLEAIRTALLADPGAAGHVIPQQADLSVLSL